MGAIAGNQRLYSGWFNFYDLRVDNLANCYQILGLSHGASIREIKSAYRQLARRYHPDTCPVELRSQAQNRFIELTHAYQQLLERPEPSVVAAPPPEQPAPSVTPIRKQQDYHLKHQSYQKLQQLLQAGRFARAIALIEGLAMRFPRDFEVRQWQAIAYFHWGKVLVDQKQWGKAKVYLRKAIRTDPHNHELFQAVEQQLQRLNQRVAF